MDAIMAGGMLIDSTTNKNQSFRRKEDKGKQQTTIPEYLGHRTNG